MGYVGGRMPLTLNGPSLMRLDNKLMMKNPTTNVHNIEVGTVLSFKGQEKVFDLTGKEIGELKQIGNILRIIRSWER